MPDTPSIARPPARTNVVADRASEFVSSTDVTRDDLWRLIESANDVGTESDNAFNKRLIAIGAVWAMAYAVTENLVTEGSVGSFKIGQLALLVLWAPVAIAFLYHSITAILASSAVNASVKKVLYGKLFPHATDEQIDAITFSEGTIEAEGLIVAKKVSTSGCVWFSSGFVMVAMLFSPWLLFAHCCWLALQTPFAWWGKVLVLTLGGAAMVRSAFLQRIAWSIPPRRITQRCSRRLGVP